MAAVIWILVIIFLLGLLIFLLPYIFLFVIVIIGIGFISRFFFGHNKSEDQYEEYTIEDERKKDDVIDVEYVEEESDWDKR